MTRQATNSGCSTMLVVWATTPGISILPPGSLAPSHTCHSCSCRGLAALPEVRRQHGSAGGEPPGACHTQSRRREYTFLFQAIFASRVALHFSGEAVAVHLDLQPGKLPAAAGPTQGHQGLVLAKPPGQVHQDRRQAGSPRPAVGVPVGRDIRATRPVPGCAGAHWQIMPGAWLKQGRASLLECRIGGTTGVVFTVT